MTSLRVRLTLWYSLVLAAGLLTFGGGVWLSIRQILHTTVEASLQQHVDGMVMMTRSEAVDHPSFERLSHELAEYAATIPLGSWIDVRETSGRVLFTRQPLAGPVLGTAVSEGRYTIAGAESLAESERLLKRITWMILLAIPATLGLAGLGGYWLSGRALGPVDAITAEARSITIRNLSRRLTVPRTGDELQRLSEAWNDTLSSLDVAVNRLAQFTADASHELRSPIAIIRASAELALRRDRTAEEYRETLSNIREEAERTSQLVDDLLTMARADAGANALPVSRLDLAHLVREAADQARAMSKGREILVAAEVPPERVSIEGNEAGLRRLLSVLVENAIKFTPPGGEVRLRLTTEAVGASVEVSDTGIGMASDVLPHIFERFYRADESRNRDVGGSGLGLSIAKWIADRHGAEIEVRSVVGSGSVFQVRFLSISRAA